ncbi:MAG: acyl-coenzyme A synthetase/AMP-(fatty) acid ligase [Rubritalea sp.]|jgi:acyl-coenzyme A synthetase/AMP-(fatty) acid ligase
MNLVNQLADRATEYPDRIALIEDGREISYGDLYAHVQAGSRLLLEEGLKKGDCVLILQPISIDLYIQLLAVLHAGISVMFIDPSAGKAMMQNSLRLHHPDGFIGVAKAHLLRLNLSEIRQIKKKFHTRGWMPFSSKWQFSINPEDSISQPVEVEDDAPALITFTSGSTGMPKAACRTHGFLMAQHAALSGSLDFKEGEVDLITLPIFAIANLASGMTSVIANTDLRYPARVDSAAITEQCIEHRVTRCAASPAFFNKLYEDQSLPSFQTIYTGGAPVFPHLIDAIQRVYPKLNIVTVYGSTEAEPISHIAWNEVSVDDHKAMKSGKGLLVGVPVSATKVRIHKMRDDQVGQIAVTGDHVLKGYLNSKGDEETKFKQDGEIWHLTGDMGYFDSKNRLWLMGRESAVFEIDDRVIYPFGIECAVMHHPAVTCCAVVQHNGRNLLCLELSENNLDRVRRDFPNYDNLEFIQLEKIPKDKRHNAKVDYPSLTRLLNSLVT